MDYRNPAPVNINVGLQSHLKINCGTSNYHNYFFVFTHTITMLQSYIQITWALPHKGIIMVII